MKKFEHRTIGFIIVSTLLLIHNIFSPLYFAQFYPQRSVDDLRSADNVDNSAKILFAGDIMLAEAIGRKIDENGVKYPFEATNNYFSQADYRVGNLECVLSDEGETSRTGSEFEADPSVIEGLNYAGFNLLNLANNHILDYGGLALNDTIDNLHEGNISIIGLHEGKSIENSTGITKRPFIHEQNGLQFAFLSYMHDYVNVWHGTESYYQPMELSTDNIEKEIQYVSNQYPNAFIIVQIHWRIHPQYNLTANDFQKEYCYRAINAGADVMICHGPHVMQEIEAYSTNATHTGLIFYSIGNYVFSNINELTYKSFLTTLQFQVNGVNSFSLLPIERINFQYQPAGDVREFQVNSSLYLNWTNYEKFFQFSENEEKNHIIGFSNFVLVLILMEFGIIFALIKKNTVVKVIKWKD